MEKPQQILDLEEHLGFELRETKNSEIYSMNKAYLLNEKQEIIGLNLSTCWLTDISFLRELAHLNILILRNNQIQYIYHYPNLFYLDLSDNKLFNADKRNIFFGFENVEYLNLNNNSGIYYLGHLTNFKNLKYLFLNQVSAEYASLLGNCTKLETLSLSASNIKELDFIRNLFNLKILDISKCKINSISFIEDLKNMKELIINDNLIINISLSDFEKLEKLEVKNNPLQSIQLNNFSSIKELDLSGLKLQKVDLLNLPNLILLNLSRNQICYISFLASLYHLTNLDLSDNKISDISSLRRLIKLKNLNLSYNKISDISFLSSLTNLTNLSLGSNQISNISLNFLNSFPKLQKLELAGNPIKNIPKEIYDKGGNVLQDVRNYLESLEEDGNIPNDQIKILLLGNSTSGKTSLIEYLQKGIYQKKRVSTHGIENLIWLPFEKDEKVNETDKNLKVSVWDFGGQEFYHNTHSLFFSNNAIYLVLFEANTNFQGKLPTLINLYKEGKKVQEIVDLEHFEFSYWLENVKYLNDNKQGVLLLTQNKCDLGQIIDISDACKKEYQLQSENIFAISVEKAFEQDKKFSSRFETFKIELLEQIKSNIAKFDNSKKWQEIKNTIQSDWKKDNVLDYTEYVRRCKEIKSTIDDRKEGQTQSQLDTLTNILREQGIVLQYKHIPELKDKIFVNPAWLTDCIYKVLDYSVIKSEGKFDKAHLEKIAQTIPKITADELLALLLHFNLIFEVNQDGEQNFICPQYLPEIFKDNKDKKTVNSHISTMKYAFTLSYPKFLPVSTFLKWLAMHGKDHIDYWYNKNELLFVDNSKSVYGKCVRNKDERTITIHILNRDTETAHKLFDEFLRIDFPSDLLVSVNEGKDYVEVKKLKTKIENEPAATQIESVARENRASKSLNIKNFWLLFGKTSACFVPEIKAFAGEQFKLFQEALQSAFIDFDGLVRFCRTELEINLHTITGDSGTANATFKLIQHCESEGKLRELIEKAYQTKLDNPKIIEFIKSLNPG